MVLTKYLRKNISKKLVSLVFWPDRILVNQLLKTQAGFWIDVEPYVLIDSKASANEIGETILRFLDKRSYIIPTPKFNPKKNKINQRLIDAKCKTEKEFMNEAMHVQVSLEENILSFTPTKNGGYKGNGRGFSELVELSSNLNFTIDSVEIGNAVLQIKEKCVFQ